jgi:hypothetical protein
MLQIHGEGYVLYPQFIAAVSAEELGAPVTSLAREDMRILSALDMLMSGF